MYVYIYICKYIYIYIRISIPISYNSTMTHILMCTFTRCVDVFLAEIWAMIIFGLLAHLMAKTTCAELQLKGGINPSDWHDEIKVDVMCLLCSLIVSILISLFMFAIDFPIYVCH